MRAQDLDVVTGGLQPNDTNPLLNLPDHLLISIICAIGSHPTDLASFEATARRFWLKADTLHYDNDGKPQNLIECAAEKLARGHQEGWRVEARPGESWKYLLALLLGPAVLANAMRCTMLAVTLAPLPRVSAGMTHTLVRTAEGRVFTFGHNQLDCGDRDEAVLAIETSSPCEVERLRAQRVVSVAVAAGDKHSVALTQEGCVLLGWQTRNSHKFVVKMRS